MVYQVVKDCTVSHASKIFKYNTCFNGFDFSGNVIGYTVIRPCRPCLESCNNGHLWMYHSYAVEAVDRVDREGNGMTKLCQLLATDTRLYCNTRYM